VVTSAETVTRLQQEILQNDEELISLRNTQSSLFDSTVKGLSNLLRQQKEEIDKYLSTNQSRLREDDIRISAEEERVHMERSGVAREESALEEEKNEIEGVINSQTSEIEKDREDLEMRLMGVTAEIKNLEKMLEMKRREELELKSELLVVEEKIGVVRKKYDRRLQRIHDRVIDLTSDSEACRKEEEVIQEQRRLFLEDKSFVEKTEKDVDSWLLWMEGEIEITARLKTALENIRSQQEQEPSAGAAPSPAATGGDGHDELVMLKEKVSLAENEVNVATALVKSAQELVGKLMDEDAEIAEKLPQLEAEKKAHASNKRFKEAGNIAKTIKTLSTRKEEIAEQLQHSSSAIATAESELEMKKESYGAALRELKEAERSADIVRLDALRVQIKKLRKANRKAAKEIEKLHPVGIKSAPHTATATAAEDSQGQILQLSQIALCFLQTELEVPSPPPPPHGPRPDRSSRVPSPLPTNSKKNTTWRSLSKRKTMTRRSLKLRRSPRSLIHLPLQLLRLWTRMARMRERPQTRVVSQCLMRTKICPRSSLTMLTSQAPSHPPWRPPRSRPLRKL
jgi:chromosome segregation ATPase